MSRKKKAREATAPAPERLSARGLDADDPLSALASLASTWGEDPALEAWAVERVGALDDERAGPRLFELEPRTSDRNVRREIKRALFRLEQRGRWRTPDRPEPPKARDLLGPDEDAPQGWLSPIDPTGARLLWMARRVPGGIASLSALISEDRGILEFHAGQTTRKSLREAHAEIAARSGVRLVEAPWEWAWELLRRAHEKTERGRFPGAASALKTIVPHAPPESPAPPIDALLDRASVARDETALADSGTLLAEPEVGPWLLPLSWLEATLEGLADAGSSVVVVSPAAREERLRETFEAAVATLLDSEERRERFATRLEETAFLLARRGADAPARSAWAAALAARSGRPIAEIPVLAEITRRSLGLAFEARASRDAERERTSLVVTPQQARAEQERARRRR